MAAFGRRSRFRQGPDAAGHRARQDGGLDRPARARHQRPSRRLRIRPAVGRPGAASSPMRLTGADGLAVFGTTSEANSMSPQERMALLDHLIAAGIPAAKLMPGTGACAISDALALTRHALAHGCAGVLMLPPFYYKGMPDEGLYAFIAGVIDRIASPALKIYLYHIPPVAQVG